MNVLVCYECEARYCDVASRRLQVLVKRFGGDVNSYVSRSWTHEGGSIAFSGSKKTVQKILRIMGLVIKIIDIHEL
jgi:hypothetical protein